TGRVVTWNFAETPNTSVLVKANGEIVLSGVQDHDDVLLGTTSDFAIERMQGTLDEIIASRPKTHFGWREWT
ncbi:MAG TPA: hypothetical protein VHO25_09560, partial [Polyangiaceae bacterium]|nr:hypothetical protein [Polyangiaceae bacterium]